MKEILQYKSEIAAVIIALIFLITGKNIYAGYSAKLNQVYRESSEFSRKKEIIERWGRANEKYNELLDKGNNQGKLKALLHNKAIINLLAKIAPTKPDGILIDQFTQPDTYYKYLANQKQVQRDNVYFATKGESIHLAVAAASILARYSFVKQFDELSKKAGMQLPKGAGKHAGLGKD